MPETVHAQARGPHVMAVAASSAAVGIIQLILGQQPTNIAASASPLAADVWSALLVAGGLLVILGAWLRPVNLGLRLEGAGHLGMLFGTGIYLVTVIPWMVSPWWTSPAVWWSAAVAAASTVRAYQIAVVLWKASRV